MQLVPPSVGYKASFIEAVKEFQAETIDNTTVRRYKELSVPELERDFKHYVETQKGFAEGKGLPEGWVPATTLWLVDQGEYIGRLSIRHRLTDELLKTGGHIGYDIRPSRRSRGYGSKILELALPIAHELGIGQALLTCDETNIGSKKIIEKNGGVLQDRVEEPGTGVYKLRYWITLG
jgi:predicted acetyltransferase